MNHKVIVSLLLAIVMLASLCATAFAEELTGSADGFASTVTVNFTLENGVITAIKIDASGETPGIGGAAPDTLEAAILAAGGIDGVDGVSGATWTSNAVFAAIKQAMGIEEGAAEAEAPEAISASGLKHGVGVVCTPRLGPGKDANDVGVYSFNEIIAYVVLDNEGRIVDIETDILEVITPNHDESNEGDNFLAGWPGQSYNCDADGDGVVEGELEETEEIFTTEINSWLTKRQKGDDYKMNSGTWYQEMDIYENFFIGKTIEEIQAWADKYLSKLNGRPITAASTTDEDVAQYNALSDEEKTLCDAVAGATMSLNDAHGDILAAIAKAVENAVPVDSNAHIAKVGLGVTVVPRLGPGSDDQGVPCYSFNTSVCGICLGDNGEIIAAYDDVLEIITPNHDGADDNSFTGWPGQSYNSDDNADGVVDQILTQDEDSFVAQISSYQTKRSLGNAYKLSSGTWTDEMNAYESVMLGKTIEDILTWHADCFSDANGRALNASSSKEGDAEKFAAMSEEEKALMDSISCATMALKDAHGDIIGAIQEAYEGAKDADITVK